MLTPNMMAAGNEIDGIILQAIHSEKGQCQRIGYLVMRVPSKYINNDANIIERK